MKKSVPRWILALVSAVLSYLAFAGKLDPGLQRAGLGKIQQENAEYLDRTFDKALAGFGVMSGLKAGLAVVEGSTGGVSAGVSLNLQVGDVVQSAYDYVDIAWRTLLLGCICLLALQYLLEVAVFLGPFAFGTFLLMLALSYCWTRPPQPVRHARLLALVCAGVLYFLLPLSIWASSGLSHRITRPALDAAQQGFAETGETLFPEDPALSKGIMARIKQIPERLEQITDVLKQKTSEMSLWTVQLIAGYLFDCIFFPLGCFLLMLWASRSFLGYCYQCGQHRDLRNAITGHSGKEAG